MKSIGSFITLWLISLSPIRAEPNYNISRFHNLVYESSPHGTGNRTRRELSRVVGQITALELIQTDADVKVYRLLNGSIVSVNSIFPPISGPAFNLRAVVNGTEVRSVQFGYNRTRSVNVENVAPYAFCGNNKTDYYRCSRLGLGTHTIVATQYAKSDARGMAGVPFTLTFTIVPEDVNPPELLNFVVSTPTTVNVTTGRATINGTVTVRDDAIGFGLGRLSLGYKPDILSNYFSFFGILEFLVSDDIGDKTPIGGGKPVTYPFSMVAKRYMAPGIYPLQLLLADYAPNVLELDATALGNLGYVNTFTVINSGMVDSTAPQLLDFDALSPMSVNITKGATSVDFEMSSKMTCLGSQSAFWLLRM